MTIALKTLTNDWAKAGGSKAKVAADPITKFVKTFTTVIKEYDRARFVDGVSGNNAASDTKRYVDAFDVYVKQVEGLQRTTGLTPKETAFLNETLVALKAELAFWKTDPIVKQIPIELHEDLRKHWSARKKEAEDVFKKSHAGQRYPLKFDEDFGPMLDKFEKAKTLKDRQALGIKIGQVARSYMQQVKTNKDAIGDVVHDLLGKQLVRIDAVVKKASK